MTDKMREKLGRIAYEAAAKYTDCHQPWEEANQAKWIAAATAATAKQSDKIAELEKRLAVRQITDQKVVPLLNKIARLGNGEHLGNSIGNTMAQDCLKFIASETTELTKLLASARQEGRDEVVEQQSKLLTYVRHGDCSEGYICKLLTHGDSYNCTCGLDDLIAEIKRGK